MAAPHREVPEGDAQRLIPQALLDGGAERALVVAVDDRDRHALRSPDVVAGAERGQRGGSEIAQSASKMRFAPGSSLGERAWWLHLTTPSGPMTTRARCGNPPGCRTPKARHVAPLGSKSDSCSMSMPSWSLKAFCEWV